ncbi:uncharacterized protein [Bemisia tabaci]|uniref:uncharacterized protein isoform X2 n=1 Tax=Bemisia tabaci TaxID=7038 RepID=UPI003B280ECB
MSPLHARDIPKGMTSSRYNKHHNINFESKQKASNNHKDKYAYQKRNELFLKSLEIATAKLRTQFYFCPTERCLEKAKRKYISSLQV